MTATDEPRLAGVPRIVVPGDHRVAPGLLGFGREGALAQAEAAFRRADDSRGHGR